MKKKYLLMGTSLYSEDKDMPCIRASKLCLLYNLNPKECVFADISRPSTWIEHDNLIKLYPRSDGNYPIINK